MGKARQSDYLPLFTRGWVRFELVFFIVIVIASERNQPIKAGQ